MIAVDTNILVYAHRRDSACHAASRDAIRKLAEGKAAWAIPWPCVHEFLAVVTHPRIFSPPSTMDQAAEQVDAWLESPASVLLAEAPDHWAVLRRQLLAGAITGPRVHDGRIAAICVAHGVRELLSADRDFSRFPDLEVVNPIVAS
ncbi:MAG: TA system VapC family ribonuclease toxin [Planctomycetota bacterium]